jgi:hypothetical protein
LVTVHGSNAEIDRQDAKIAKKPDFKTIEFVIPINSCLARLASWRLLPLYLGERIRLLIFDSGSAFAT